MDQHKKGVEIGDEVPAQVLIITELLSGAFKAFQSDESLFALPFRMIDNDIILQSAIIYPSEPGYSFQQCLSLLDPIVDTKNPLYLVVRDERSLVLITYIPYLANNDVKSSYVKVGQSLASVLGKDNFSLSVICKEPGDITDARAWEERDERWSHQEAAAACKSCAGDIGPMKELGHMKTKCRLCDRRMKNGITNEALEMLKKLDIEGSCAQLVSYPFRSTP